MTKAQKAGLIIGLFTSVAIYFFGQPNQQNSSAIVMAAIAALMAIWWITEAIPLAATSMLPLVLFPLFGISDGEKVASSYINSVIFLFLGGFIIALAMEQWNLHKRISLKIISWFGGTPSAIVIGFMSATAFISMWISNTAAALMMLPIALSVINNLETKFGKPIVDNFSKAMMLGIAYSSSIGGMATLVGTPPNLAFIKILQISFPDAPPISFGSWMVLSFPVSALMLIAAIILLTKIKFKLSPDIKVERSFIQNEYKNFGSISFEEKIVGIIFTMTALLWIFRTDLNFGFIKIPGWQNLLPFPDFINDGTVAIFMSLIMFFIPSKNSLNGKNFIIDLDVFQRVPWSIILLFGGGFALAQGFSVSGLSELIGKSISGLSFLSPLILVIIVAFSMNFLTELTSNTATANMILPILASISVAMEINPLLLMIAATLSVSMAFMLPVGTPPNTIVFASGRLKISDMAITGFVLNIIGVVIVTALVYFLGTILFDLSTFPNWAIIKK